MISFNIPIQKASDVGGDFLVEGVATSSTVDLDGDVIAKELVDALPKELVGKPILKDHNRSVDSMIGVVEDAWNQDGKAIIRAKISKTAKRERTLLEEGILKSFSIGGFVPAGGYDYDENGNRIIKSLRIEEISFTPTPANPEANIMAVIAKAAKKVTNAEWEAPPQSVRDELPADYFLLPSERKFPYKEWKGPNKGAINCNGLRAAISRAAQHGYAEVERKARELYERHCAVKKSCGCEESGEMSEDEVKKETPQEQVEKSVEEVKESAPEASETVEETAQEEEVEKSLDVEAIKKEFAEVVKSEFESIRKAFEEKLEAFKKEVEENFEKKSTRESLVKKADEKRLRILF